VSTVRAAGSTFGRCNDVEDGNAAPGVLSHTTDRLFAPPYGSIEWGSFMLSRVSEPKMLGVRGLLLLAWIALIASFFWDPYSIRLTELDNAMSPFRITDQSIRVQDGQLTASPYPLGARVFWTMLIPIVPLFLMVFGHEAWRRICPLSFASQIPGYLGLRRYRTGLDRRSGSISRKVALIDRQSWLARNSWYVQFGLLFVGITARLLIINTDRQALAIAAITAIVSAMATGVLWGGKTWCNYFCPVNVVQKIYTEPSGILESTPHFSRPALPQSMCRKPSREGDVSACVSCAANCSDIDLQGAYWNALLEPQRKNVYYMFFGLIIGFYGYYYLYSGGWEYYFSGIWTHEADIWNKLFSPGFYILGHAIPIPKIVAAPLTLGIACAASLSLGRISEALYRRLRSSKEGMSETIIVHHCLSVAAWMSINAFYLFGGRPNLLLLPPLAWRVIDVGIVALTTLWLRRALQQNPTRYQQESMASGLLRELKKLKVNVAQILGRKLEQLKPDELYLLMKVLPGLPHDQKLHAYRSVLDEAVTTGSTANATSLQMLEDVRQKMSITEAEHMQLLEELGIAGTEAPTMTAEEKLASLIHYRSILGSTVAGRLDTGAALVDIFQDPSFQSTVAVLRQSLHVSQHEHDAAIEELSSQSGIVGAKMNEALDALARQKSVRLRIEEAEMADPLGSTLLDILLDHLDAHEQAMRLQALSILRNFGPEREFQRHARELALLSGPDLELILRQAVPSKPKMRWREALDPTIFAVLSGQASFDIEEAADQTGTERRSSLSQDVEGNLSALLAIEDPVVRAIGLTVFGYIEPQAVKDVAEKMLVDKSESDHPMLVAALEQLAGVVTSGDPDRSNMTIRATVQIGRKPAQDIELRRDLITIGRAPGNDIAIADPAVWTYHAGIVVKHGEVRLIRVDEGELFVNGRQVQEESIKIEKESVISVGNIGRQPPTITVNWSFENHFGGVFFISPVLRLAMLAQNNQLSRFSTGTLANIAWQSRVERYTRGAKLEREVVEEHVFLVHQGQIRLFDPLRMDFVPDVTFGPGDLFCADSVDSELFPEVCSEFAIVMHVPPMPEVKAAIPWLKFARLKVMSGSEGVIAD
jgi:pSer/pThr/pTyr-binding forkhead associated (FHA) protein